MLEDLDATSGDDITVTLSDSDLNVSVYDDDIDVRVDASISINGQGIIPGGTIGQFLAKKTSIDFDMEWKDVIVGVPVDGVLGQILTKMGPEPYNTAWQNPVPAVPSGGTTGYILSKASNSNYDMAWVPPVDTALFVAKTGDAMTGLLTLSGNPTDSMHAVTKQYSDLKAPLESPALTGVPTTPTPAGGAPSDQIANIEYVQSTVGAYLPLSGGTLTNFLTLHANPTAPEHAATKLYVDTKAPITSPTFLGTPTAPTAAPGTVSAQLATTQFVQTAVGAYLPLSGGALTGAINMGDNVIANLGAPQQSHHAARRADVDLKANIASPAFTGVPTAPTPSPVDVSTKLATTEFVSLKAANYLLLAGGALSGFLLLHANPTLALHAATKQYVDAADALMMPKLGGTFTGPVTLVGDPVSALQPATKQYVDLKAPIDSPAFTGIPTAPTALSTDNSTQLATTAFVQSVVTAGAAYLPISGGTLTGPLVLFSDPTAPLGAATKQYVDTRAPLASPVFTGAPTAPTPVDNSVPTRLATTDYVATAVSALYLPLAGGTLTGGLTVSAGNLIASGGQIQIDRTGDASDADLYLKVDMGKTSLIRWTTGASQRWYMGKSATVESGADSGSNFRLGAYTDAGGTNDVITIDRATRVTNFLISPTAPTPAPGTNNTQLATTAFVTAAGAALPFLPLTGGTLSNFLSLHADPTAPAHASNKAYVDARTALYLPLTGGTLSGLLTLSGAPSSDLHAATQKYVDDGLLPKANLVSPTFTGIPTAPTAGTTDNSQQIATTAYVKANTALYLPLTGGALSNFLSLHADPTSALHATTKQYVDTKAGLYLPLAGGTLTGTVTGTSFIATGSNAFRVNRVGQALDGDIFLDVDAGRTATITFRTGTTKRWAFNKGANAESGSDAGSPLTLTAYSDAGANLGDVFSIIRATRILTFPVSPVVPTLSVGTNTTQAASMAAVLAADNLKLNLTGGTLSGNLINGNGYIQINRFGDAADAIHYMNADAGFNAMIHFFTGNATNRWRIGKNNVAESGGDAGSEFFLSSYNDAGVLQSVFLVKRSDRIVAFSVTPTAPTMGSGDSSTRVATTAFVATAIAGATTGGVPAAGAANQVLTKKTATNYDMEWRDPAGTGTFLQLTGGTLTGKLTLDPADQTGTNDAATIGYVDTADNLKANIASPIFTGNPRVPNVVAGDNSTTIANTSYVDSAVAALSVGSYLLKAGGTMTGDLVLAAGSPAGASSATTKLYVDNADALLLPKAGGTMTGAISMGGFVISNVADPTQAHHAVNRAYADTKAPLNDATLTGTVTAPTQLTSDRSDKIATTDYVWDVGDQRLADYLPKVGGTMLGSISMGGFVISNLADPSQAHHAINRGWLDAALTSKANLASPTFSGNPQAPTAGAGALTQQIANTQFVTTADNLKANLAGATFTGAIVVLTPTADMHPATRLYVDTALLSKANLASPIFTGIPQAPNPAGGDYSQQIATTKFVTDAVSGAGAFLPITGGTLTGMLFLPATTPTDANHATRKGYVDAQVALKASLTGANFTGPVNITDSHLNIDRVGDAANANFYMSADPGFLAQFNLNSTGGQSRWRFGKGPGVEGVGNTNSDFVFAAFANDGASLGDVLTLRRTDRVAQFAVPPKAPTPAPGTNDTQLATTAFVNAAIGGGGSFLPITGGTLTGKLTLDPADQVGSNDAATIAMVALKSNLNSPDFTGEPKAITPLDNSTPTRLATTGYVAAVTAPIVAAYLPKAGGTMTGDINMNNSFRVISLVDPTQSHHAVNRGYADAMYAPLVSAALTGSPTAPTQATTNISTRIATTEFAHNLLDSTLAAYDFMRKIGGTFTGPIYLPAANPVFASEAAHKGYVDTKAPLVSPAFTGTPTAPNPSTSVQENIATTGYVASNLANYLLKNAAVLTGHMNSNNFSITNVPTPTQNHHATNKAYVDLFAKLISPGFSGVPTTPTPDGGASLQIANVAYVQTVIGAYLPKSGGVLTNALFLDDVAIPNDTNNIYLAVHKNFVQTNFAPIISPALSGVPTTPTPDGGTSLQIANCAYVESKAGVFPKFATRDDIANQNAGVYPVVFLEESSREGWFEWTYGDFQAQVAADTYRGVYIPPVGTPNGSQGAWVRVVRDYFLPGWFGAIKTTDLVPIPANANTANNTAAFQSMINLAALKGQGSPIHLDGNYYVGQLTIPQPIQIYGRNWSRAKDSLVAPWSAIFFDHQGSGIAFDMANSFGSTGMAFENFRLVNSRDNGDAAALGWHQIGFRTKITGGNRGMIFRQLQIGDFSQSGIELYDSYSNIISDCTFSECGSSAFGTGQGLLIEGLTWGAPEDPVNRTASTGNEIRGNYFSGCFYGIYGGSNNNLVMFQRFVENKYEECQIGLYCTATRSVILDHEYFEANYVTGAILDTGIALNCNQSGNVQEGADNKITFTGAYMFHDYAQFRIGADDIDFINVDLLASTALDEGIIKLQFKNGQTIFTGTSGAGTLPEGVVSAAPGSIYMRNGSGAPAWVKRIGTGNTGWAALQYAAGIATADRPSPAQQGQIIYNTTLAKFEGYTGSAWVALH